MIDLGDLDRRAALAMGFEIDSLYMGAITYERRGGSNWGRRWEPTTNANDCREFEQLALAHGAITIGTIVESNVATASIHVLTSGRWRSAHTNPAEHGPSYDLVARVLALLDALETEK